MKVVMVLLAKAREILKDRGWTQGAFKRPDAGYCATGALYSALGVEDDALENDTFACWEVDKQHPEMLYAKRALNTIVGDIIAFNDSGGQTSDRVIAAFLRAEDLLENGFKREEDVG